MSSVAAADRARMSRDAPAAPQGCAAIKIEKNPSSSGFLMLCAPAQSVAGPQPSCSDPLRGPFGPAQGGRAKYNYFYILAPASPQPVAPSYVPLHEVPVGGKFYSVGPSASYGGRGTGLLGRAAGVVCTLVRPATSGSGRATCLIRLPSKKTKVVSSNWYALCDSLSPHMASPQTLRAVPAGGNAHSRGGAQLPVGPQQGGVSNPKHNNTVLGKAGAAR